MPQNSLGFKIDAQPAGLYIHIPFCLKKCPYCDFYSITDASFHQDFLDALSTEMRLNRHVGLVFDTLYIGGGTPSVLDETSIHQMVETARRSFKILPGAEITLEVNPGTVTLEKLKGYGRAGVNRINIGVQSFNSANLRFLGRIHSDQDAELAVRWARSAGFDNIGLDLIYGIPDQTPASWRKDLKAAVEFGPQHLSCYILSVEPGTPMDRDRKKGRFEPMSEDRVCDLFETTVKFLRDHGYVQYEISNFAREDIGESGLGNAGDNRSRHNTKYWTFAPYLGLGPSAHSFIEPERFWNHADVGKYIQDLAQGKLPLAEKEFLTLDQLMTEAVYLGLRQTRGISVDAFDEKFGVNFRGAFGEVIADLEERGLMECSHGRCALTSKGMLVLDSIAALFI
jgi:oxygen-independent coproporphyrinogen-3 oxidase